jgi:hypothetical protein
LLDEDFRKLWSAVPLQVGNAGHGQPVKTYSEGECDGTVNSSLKIVGTQEITSYK